MFSRLRVFLKLNIYSLHYLHGQNKFYLEFGRQKVNSETFKYIHHSDSSTHFLITYDKST